MFEQQHISAPTDLDVVVDIVDVDVVGVVDIVDVDVVGVVVDKSISTKSLSFIFICGSASLRDCGGGAISDVCIHNY